MNGYQIVSKTIDKQSINESGVVVGSYIIMVAVDYFVQYFVSFIILQAMEANPIDKGWTDFLNSKLPSKLKNKYIVRVMKETTPNAFKTMGDNNIYLTTGLIKHFTKDEIMAIMIHEIGHGIYNHSEKKMLGNSALVSLLKLVSILIGLENRRRRGKGLDFDLKTNEVIEIGYYLTKKRIPHKRIVIPLMILIWISVPVMFRFMEHSADSYAVKLGYKDELARALIKLNGIKSIKPSSLLFKIMRMMSKIFITHPKTKKRLIRILGSEEAIEAFKTSKNGKDLKDKIEAIVGDK